MTENTKIIEINGVKFEVDARTATMKQIANVKLGARVKVMVPSYGDQVTVHHGVVVGFEPFQNNPVIIVAYLTDAYSSAPEIKFLYFTAKSKESIVISDEDDRQAIARDQVVEAIDKKIAKLQAEITDLEDRKTYFLKNFKTYWHALSMPSVEKETADA